MDNCCWVFFIIIKFLLFIKEGLLHLSTVLPLVFTNLCFFLFPDLVEFDQSVENNFLILFIAVYIQFNDLVWVLTNPLIGSHEDIRMFEALSLGDHTPFIVQEGILLRLKVPSLRMIGEE